MGSEICGGGRIFGFGPCGDKGPQGGIGREGPMVAVAVNARWGKDVGEAIQELQGRESEGGTAAGIGLGKAVEDLVGAAADQVEAFEGSRRPWRRAERPICRWCGALPSGFPRDLRTMLS